MKKEIPIVSEEAVDRCVRIMENRIRFNNCLEYLVCPKCMANMTKSQYLSSLNAKGVQDEITAYKCTKCEFTW